MPPYSLLPNGWQNRHLFSLHSSLPQESLHSGGLQLPSPPLGLKSTSDSCGEEVFNWIISSNFPLNDHDTPTPLHRSYGSHSSPDILFAPSSLPFSCSWEVLQDLGSDHLPIFLSVPLPPAYRPDKHLLPSPFRKLAGMALPPTLTLTVHLQRNTCLFPLLLLFLPLWH